jgi:hypothetical protein
MRPSLVWDVTQHRLVVNDVSGQTTGTMFKDQGDQSKDCLTLEDGTDSLSRNVGNYQSTLCNIPEGRRCQSCNGWLTKYHQVQLSVLFIWSFSWLISAASSR